MAQQINLYVPDLRPPRLRLHAAAALGVVVATTIAGAGVASLLQWQARGDAQRSVALQQAADALQAQVAARQAASPTTRTSAQEIERLRQQLAAQQKVRSVLESGSATAAATTPSEFLLALARQTHPSLWITGFAVSADERTLEIRGRMLDTSALPDYLRRLNAETRFKGRSFAQLDIRTPESPAGSPTSAASAYPEFVLRSTVPLRDGAETTR